MFWSTTTSLFSALVLQSAQAAPAPLSTKQLKTSDKVLTLKRTGVKAGSSKGGPTRSHVRGLYADSLYSTVEQPRRNSNDSLSCC